MLISVLFMYILCTSTVVYVTIWDVRPTRKAIINNTGLQRNPFFVNVVMAEQYNPVVHPTLIYISTMYHIPTVLVCKHKLKVWKGSNLMSDHGILCRNLQATVTQ